MAERNKNMAEGIGGASNAFNENLGKEDPEEVDEAEIKTEDEKKLTEEELEIEKKLGVSIEDADRKVNKEKENLSEEQKKAVEDFWGNAKEKIKEIGKSLWEHKFLVCNSNNSSNC